MRFEDAKEAYRQARCIEREKIRQLLRDLSFSVTDGQGAGEGPRHYPRNSQRIQPKLDLRNWMWVEGKHQTNESIQVLVTLQVLDWDPDSRNVHALFDRIGVIPFSDAPHPKLHPKAKTPKPTSNKEADIWVSDAVLGEQFHTDIDLPLTDEKLRRLKQIVADRCGIPLEDE